MKALFLPAVILACADCGRPPNQHSEKEPPSSEEVERKNERPIFPSSANSETAAGKFAFNLQAATALRTDNPRLSQFAAIAKDSVVLDPQASVIGDVGTLQRHPTSPTVTLQQHALVEGDVYAAYAYLNHFSSTHRVHADTVAGPGQYQALFPFPSMPRLPLPIHSQNAGQSITLKPHERRSLNPGAYNDIELQPHAELTLAGGQYFFNSLQVSPHARLISSTDVRLIVRASVVFEPQASWNGDPDTTARSMRIDLEGSSATIHEHAEVRALLLGPDATVELRPHARFVGAIAAREIQIGPHATVVYEDGLGCRQTTCAMLGVGCGVYPDGCGGVLNCGACTQPEASCFGVSLTASQTHDPDAWLDGSASLGADIQIVIPDTVAITQGTLGANATATLSLWNSTTANDQCTYYARTGTAGRFTFGACASGARPGSLVDASLFALHVDNPGLHTEATTIALRLDAQPCNCLAATCSALGAQCGVRTDGCGGLLNCGGCVSPDTCGGDPQQPSSCGCVPRTCDEIQCGQLDDGCGGTLQCGECDAPETCGGAGNANLCGCQPETTCRGAALRQGLSECEPSREILRACEELLLLKDFSRCESLRLQVTTCTAEGMNDCSELQASLAECELAAPPLYPADYCAQATADLQACVNEKTEAALRAECGSIPDGCGGHVICEACEGFETCGGAGEQNVCGCRAATCADFARSCGGVTDGCGGILQCGQCQAPSSCDPFEGRCTTPVLVSQSDPCAAGSSIRIDPADVAPGQVFFSTCNSDFPAGTSVDSTHGKVVTIGPAVNFGAGGMTTFAFGTCADLCVPYSSTLLSEHPPATVSDIQLYVVESGPRGPILVPVPSQRVDVAAQRVCTCSPHLSTYIVALREFCSPSITDSIALSNAGGNLRQIPTNDSWTVDSTKTVTFASVATSAPPVRITVPGGTVPIRACVGALLFFGQGGFSRVCQYETSDRTADACYFPFNSTPIACPNLADGVQARLVDCYDVQFTDGAAPPALGPFAMYAGRVNGLAAWVNPRASRKDDVIYADTYNLSLWLTNYEESVPDTPAILATTEVKSHPRTCVTSDVLSGLSACGEINDGCGGKIQCSPPCPGPGCPCLGELCCGGSPSCTQHARTNVCGCPDGNPECSSDVRYCGVPIAQNLIDTSNPCREVQSCVPATPPAQVSTIVYRARPDAAFCSGDITDKCAGLGRCFAGTCISGPKPIIDDGDPCTEDLCSRADGVVTHKRTLCTPEVNGGCVPGSPMLSTDINDDFNTLAQQRRDALKSALQSSCPDCNPVLK